MTVDIADYARKLRIVNVFQPGNPTGKVTDKRLYDPAAGQHVYAWKGGKGLILHGTVGTDTLSYWLSGGTIATGEYSMAQYLVAKDDYTVYKMAPDGYSTNHCGDSSWYDPAIVQPLNSYFYGIENENLQNWREPITEAQHIKCALIWAYLSARDRMLDRYVLSHSQIANPKGRRSDPEAGLWQSRWFWRYVEMARNEPAVWQFWGLPRWDGQ